MNAAETTTGISPDLAAELRQALDDLAKGIRRPEKMQAACIFSGRRIPFARSSRACRSSAARSGEIPVVVSAAFMGLLLAPRRWCQGNRRASKALITFSAEIVHH